MFSTQILSQLKELGMPGEHLVHAQQLVALEVNLEQEAILVTNHALEATPIPKIVMVSRENY